MAKISGSSTPTRHGSSFSLSSWRAVPSGMSSVELRPARLSSAPAIQWIGNRLQTLCTENGELRESSECGVADMANNLTARLDPILLRGVAAKHILRCQTFRNQRGSASEHELSRIVKVIDDFISHSWQNGWSTKLISLCLLYNRFAACCCSFTIGAALTILQFDSVAVLPKYQHQTERYPGYRPGLFSTCLCPLVFLIILFKWQEINSMIGMRTERIAFLDKICIDQTNDEKKTEAILGLGGFLRDTNRLVVLWTPRYFTRLWCVFEVASWLHLEKPLQSVIFIPAGQTWYLFSAFIASSLLYICRNLFSIFGSPVGFKNAADLLLLILLLPPWVHAARHLTNSLQELPQILSQFQLQGVQCSCCTNNHVHPCTGEELPCDRVLVLNTIEKWFATDGNNAQAAHAYFEQIVRTSFGETILRRAGPTQLPYACAMIVSFPPMWHVLDIAASAETCPSIQFALRRWIGEYLVLSLAVIPSWLKIVLHICKLTNNKFGWKRSVLVNVMISCLATIVAISLMLILWGPLAFLNGFFDSSFPLVMWDVICIVLVVSLYRPTSYPRPHVASGGPTDAAHWEEKRCGSNADGDTATIMSL